MPEAIIITKWKNEVKTLLKLKYGDKFKENKIDDALDKIIEKRFKNKQCLLINNYAKVNNKPVHMNKDLLSITDMIHKHNLIVGGDAVLYLQHGVIDNPVIKFIMELMALRSKFKALRKKFKKYSFEYNDADLSQLNTKVKINALYGVLGYKRFHLFNIFLAKSVTSFGQNIISTAACAFENFLADNLKIVSEGEMLHYVFNIKNEVAEKYADSDFSIIPDKSVDEVINRLKSKSSFKWTQAETENLVNIVAKLPGKVRKLLYYKNNLYEFSRLPFMKVKIKFIINGLTKLLVPELDTIEDENIKNAINDLWKFYETFVVYDYPSYDRIRKTKYTPKQPVLYMDTDSNFLTLNRLVQFVKMEVLEGEFEPDIVNMDFKIVNVITLILTRVVACALYTMARSLNISDEYAKKLVMKNECFFRRVVFSSVKKRYFALMILQEGVLLNDGKGFTEFKGFDFVKSNTKETVRNKYKDICYNQILAPDKINNERIMIELFKFQDEIDQALKDGDTKFYKQSNIGVIEKYKYPLRIQGVRGIMFWNAMCPQYAIQLPSDVDIVPITLSDKKKLEKFAAAFPAEYSSLMKTVDSVKDKMATRDDKGNIIKVPNVELNVIAKPKNPNIILPPWFFKIIDYEKIELDALSLIYPILQSLDIKTLKTRADKEHFTNIVNL